MEYTCPDYLICDYRPTIFIAIVGFVVIGILMWFLGGKAYDSSKAKSR